MCRTLGFLVGVLTLGVASMACAGDPLPTDAGNSVVVEKRVPPDVRGSFPTPANFPATDLPRAKSRGPYQPLYLTYVPADVDPRYGYVVTPQRVLRTDWRVPPGPPRVVVPRYGRPLANHAEALGKNTSSELQAVHSWAARHGRHRDPAWRTGIHHQH